MKSLVKSENIATIVAAFGFADKEVTNMSFANIEFEFLVEMFFKDIDLGIGAWFSPAWASAGLRLAVNIARATRIFFIAL